MNYVHNIFLTVFLFIIVFSFGFQKSDAAFINEDTVWTKDHGVIIIDSILELQPGFTLTIKSGTIIKFTDAGTLISYGNLIIEGTESEKVYFTSIDNDEIGGDTNNNGSTTVPDVFNKGGIHVYEGGTATIAHADISYGEGIVFWEAHGQIKNTNIKNVQTGVQLYAASILDIQSSTIANVFRDGLIVYSDSRVNAESIIIENVLSSDGFGVYYGKINVNKSVIRNIDGGAAVALYDGEAIVNNTIFENGLRTAISVYDARNGDGTSYVSLQNSTVRNFRSSGVGLYDTTADIKNSIFTGNGTGIEMYDSWINRTDSGLTRLKIEYSAIYDNRFGIDNYALYPAQAQNNWWGDISGPYHEESNLGGLGNGVWGADYIPWLMENPFEIAQCCSSVAFIPGLQASRLYKKDSLREDQLWEPNWKSDIEDMYLNSDGTSIHPNIYTKDSIDTTNLPIIKYDIYKSFFAMLGEMKDLGEIENWKALPYDWRLDIRDIVNIGTKNGNNLEIINLVDEVIQLARTSKTGKVTLVAHSNGGLAGKLLIQELEKRGKHTIIDTYIMVATPQLGTPVSIGALLHGDEQGLGPKGIILNGETARKFGENMPGAYNLLPSAKYFEIVDEPVVVFDESVDKVANYREIYGSTINNKNDLFDFFLGTRDKRMKPYFSNVRIPNILNGTLLERASNTHTAIDSWQPPVDVKVVQIAGWGIPTWSGIHYYAKEVCDRAFLICKKKYELARDPILTIDGDKTVVTPSAVAMEGIKFYIDVKQYNEDKLQTRINREHKDILEIVSVRELIRSLIEHKGPELPSYTTLFKPTDKLPNLRLKMASPVDVSIYDGDGNHTGKIYNEKSDFEYKSEEIPNSYYFELDDRKYLGVPQGEYTVKLSGTDFGSFRFDISEFEGDNVVSVRSFIDVPVSPTMKAHVTITSTGEVDNLKIDYNSDGIIDTEIVGGLKMSTIEYLQGVKAIVNSFAIHNGVKKSLKAILDGAIKSFQIDNVKSARNQLEAFINHVNAQNGKLIDENSAEGLIKVINELLR